MSLQPNCVRKLPPFQEETRVGGGPSNKKKDGEKLQRRREGVEDGSMNGIVEFTMTKPTPSIKLPITNGSQRHPEHLSGFVRKVLPGLLRLEAVSMVELQRSVFLSCA